jgi:hypothetical protein
MKRSEQFVLLSLLTALACAGCIPEEGPVYLSDGKTIVTRAEDETGKPVMWTYDSRSRTVKAFPPPTNWTLSASRAFGNQIWVQFELFHAGDARIRRSSYSEYTCKRFDPLNGPFLDGPQELEGVGWLERAIPASYEEKTCFFLEDKNEEHEDVFSFPELRKANTVRLVGKARAAGNFWWLLRTHQTNEQGISVECIDVFDPHSKKLCTIDHDELVKIREGFPPRYARVSNDGKALLLVDGSDNSGVRGFGVFDTQTGKLLWGHQGSCASAWGTPLVKSSEIWTMEHITKQKDLPTTNASEPSSSEAVSQLGLVRYSPGTPLDGKKATREEIMVFPIEMKGSNPRYYDQFTVSPDGSHFAM